MAHIIAVTNQKGGVGKTTTSINLAAALAQVKRRVLLLDIDPQGNATMGSGTDKNHLTGTLNEVLLNELNIEQAIITQTAAGYHLLPANSALTAAEVALLSVAEGTQILKQKLTTIAAQYDYIFIDCPPSLNMLTLNALVAADKILIPMQCEYYALEGLAALMETIQQLQQTVNPQLRVLGILRTMYDPRNRLALEVTAQLQEHFAAILLKTVIPRNVRLAEAPSHGLPIMLYDKYSRGTVAYLNLAAEVLQRQ